MDNYAFFDNNIPSIDDPIEEPTNEIGEFPSFMTETTFQLQIEDMVNIEGMNYIEAVVNFCEINDVEFESISKILTSNLKDKIKLAAMESGLMRKESMLPI